MASGRKTGGRQPGSKNRKTLEWEALGQAVIAKHTARFNRILGSAKDDQFVGLYLQTLEYFKPKLGRTEHTGKDGAPLPAPQIVLRAE